jgi:RNA polymerase-associated protein LEO1
MIYRWSDGSVTIGVGDGHYQILAKSEAPPRDKPYQELQDGHYFAAAAHLSSNLLMVVGQVSEQYTVQPNKSFNDDAVERLKERMEAAQRTAGDDMIIHTTEDPELRKKQAEQAEKERMKAQRRREAAASRLDVGGSRYSRGGLSVNDLEGGSRSASGRKRGLAGNQRAKKRRPEYDSDDDLPQGARRGEDYDLADDFIAPSDEDGESEAVEDDEDDLLDDEEEAPRSKRQKAAEEDNDADADGDLDDDIQVQAYESSRSRRRNIIDDDDE